MNDEENEDTFETEENGEFFQPPAVAETPDENARKMGLGLAAGAALGGSVVVLGTVGWLIDRAYDSAPNALVGGIILGAVVGFVQFFWLTSRINRK